MPLLRVLGISLCLSREHPGRSWTESLVLMSVSLENLLSLTKELTQSNLLTVLIYLIIFPTKFKCLYQPHILIYCFFLLFSGLQADKFLSENKTWTGLTFWQLEPDSSLALLSWLKNPILSHPKPILLGEAAWFRLPRSLKCHSNFVQSNCSSCCQINLQLLTQDFLGP